NSFSKEITSVKKNNLWGYIDKVGKTVIPFNFEAANPFYNGIASVKEKGKWYLINEKGDRIKMINCDDIYPFSEGGIARCKKDSKYGFINIEGKFIINPIYEEAKDFDFYLAEVKLNGKQIILDTFNRSLFKDFDKTYNFDHYIIVEKENKKGLIDKDLKDILPIKFDDIKIINDDLFFVKSENYWNIINKNNTIISPKYTQIEPETYSNPPKLFKICDEKGCGVFSISDKKEIINTYYNDIQIYESCIIVTKDKKSGIYDRQGNIMLPVEYDSSFEIVGNLVKFKKDNKYGLFSIKEKNIKIYPNYSEIYVLNDLIIEAQTKDNKKICFSTTTFKQTNCPF
ncbi:MAG: WG repeat-containing protein, partial [Elusimicrobiales bacterium]|nr:WG repeat-containing protein [Elusimicrobiales bacterium]